MTDNDALELSRYQASTEEAVERAIDDIDGAIITLCAAALTGEGLRTLRQSRDRLHDMRVKLGDVLMVAPPLYVAADKKLIQAAAE